MLLDIQGDMNAIKNTINELKKLLDEEKSEEIIKETYCKGYEAGYNAGKEDLQMLQTEIDRLKKNGKTN